MKTWNITHDDNRHAPKTTAIFNNGMRDIYEDTVFFDDDFDDEYVRDSLVNYDGYNPDIIVELER